MLIKVGFMLIFQGLFVLYDNTGTHCHFYQPPIVHFSQLLYLQAPDLCVAHVYLCVYQGVWHQYGGGVWWDSWLSVHVRESRVSGWRLWWDHLSKWLLTESLKSTVWIDRYLQYYMAEFNHLISTRLYLFVFCLAVVVRVHLANAVVLIPDVFFTDYPPGYLPSEDKTSKNLLGSATSMCWSSIFCLCFWFHEYLSVDARR